MAVDLPVWVSIFFGIWCHITG